MNPALVGVAVKAIASILKGRKAKKSMSTPVEAIKVVVNGELISEDVVQGELLSTKVPKRVFILNVLQFLGILTAALAVPTPESQAIIAMLPQVIGEWVGVVSVALLTAKPVINFFGDWLDNGRLDKSWKH